MTPTQKVSMGNLVTVKKPSFTYKIDIKKEEINGNTDGVEAVKQAIYLMMNIERYKYGIFSSNYGIELENLFGKDIDYVIAKLPTRITEALVQDDRISDVIDFEFKKGKGVLYCNFTAKTSVGDIRTGMEVRL